VRGGQPEEGRITSCMLYCVPGFKQDRLFNEKRDAIRGTRCLDLSFVSLQRQEIYAEAGPEDLENDLYILVRAFRGLVSHQM
jgi:hypothetical protein